MAVRFIGSVNVHTHAGAKDWVRVPVHAYPSGRAWTCATGLHRWHRSREMAFQCAFLALPIVKVPVS